MKIATVLTPLDETNLALAAQCGVEGVVVRYPGTELSALAALQEMIQRHGMLLCAVEGYLPIEKIKVGRDDDGAELRDVHKLLRNMRTLGIDLLCYNFMAGTDWVRTRVDAPERAGAKVTAFRLSDAQRAVSLNHRPTDATLSIDTESLWRHLHKFLESTLPVAEAEGVTMCMHPDDPPLERFAGKARIMNSVENLERLMRSLPSPRNKICFCVGTFATMGVDIPAAIERLAPHIGYVHFRDARGTREDFVETFHDNGPTDMAGVIRALDATGFAGYMRPDHVPQLVGEEDGEPGYTMLGRLFAYGYMRGLLHGVKGNPERDRSTCLP